MKWLRLSALISGILFSCVTYATGEVPQTLTLDGRLYNADDSTTALLDPTVQLVVQILSSDKSCILYEEVQAVNTVHSDGYFNIQVGSLAADPKRTMNDAGNTMASIFQNLTAIPGKGHSCASPYTPSSAKERYVRIMVIPSGGAEEVMTPDMLIDSVPQALVAETLQGKGPDGYLQLGAGQLTQANAENIFSNTNYPLLTGLLAGNSPMYVQNAGNGAALPGFTSTPTGVAPGSLWFDTSTDTLKFYDGSTTQTLTDKVVAGSGLNGGTITSSGTISLANTTVTVGTYGSATQIPQFTVDAQGRLTQASNITLSASNITTGILPVANGGTGTNNGSITGTGTLAFASSSNGNILLMPSGTGNVGIGTTTPTNSLEIRGSPSVIDVGSGALMGPHRVNVNGGGPGVNFGFYLDGSPRLYSNTALVNETIISDDGSGAPIYFNTGGGTRMIITGGGAVGIGTTSPGATLDVAGGIKPGNVSTGAGCGSEGTFAYDAGAHAPVYCSNSGVWTAMGGGGPAPGTAGAACTSVKFPSNNGIVMFSSVDDGGYRWCCGAYGSLECDLY